MNLRGAAPRIIESDGGSEKRPSLTVLGGPLAGTRFVIDESFETVVLGADESCDFRLALPGVDPVHARLYVDKSGVTIQDAGSDGGLHVNDNPVPDTGQVLRNGDIVWLGSPGEPEVVMLQCILPRVTGSAAAPVEESAPAEDETLALAPDTLFSTESASADVPTQIMEVPSEEAPTEILDIAREAMGGEAEPAYEEPETLAMPAPETIEPDPEPTTIMTPAGFEDETVEPPLAFPDESAETLVVEAADDADLLRGAHRGGHPLLFGDGAGADDGAAAGGPRADSADKAPRQRLHRRRPRPPSCPRPMPRRERLVPLVPRRPERRSRPRRRRVPLPSRGRPPRRQRPALLPARAPPIGRYAAIGLVALLVLGAGGWGAMRFLRSRPSTPPPTPTPAAVVQATPIPPPVTQAAAPTPAPVVARPSRWRRPRLWQPRPPRRPRRPPPLAARDAYAARDPHAARGPHAAPPPPPAPPGRHAGGQVAGLLGQADTSLAARQYDAAIGHYDEALRLDPGNARATQPSAPTPRLARDARRKVRGRAARWSTEKTRGGLAGFDRRASTPTEGPRLHRQDRVRDVARVRRQGRATRWTP